MSKTIKIIEKMQNNPRDWQIQDLEVLATRLGVKFDEEKEVMSRLHMRNGQTF